MCDSLVSGRRNREGSHPPTADPRLEIGDIDPRLYGSFVERVGRSIYNGIYE